MDYRRFGNTIVARFDRGEEITAQLRALCEKENIRLASVEALGATDEFTVGVYNVDEHQYHALTFTGAHEIVSLTGTVNTMNGEYYSHLHMSAANESGAVVGGHLNAARVSATCEMVIRVIDGAAEVEVSGNVTMERAARLADLGVDYVSSGAITHSAPILDLSLKHLEVLG